MEPKEFIRIVSSFADSKNRVMHDKETFMLQVREEEITISLKAKDGNLFVVEGSDIVPARTWIINRLARISVLADRIIEHLSQEVEPNFICPSGAFLEDINKGSDEIPKRINDPIGSIINTIDNRSPLCSTAMYLTSDAGEGKTTLINALAKKQAERFKKKETDWLMVPISLGGRPFLRFDEIIIAALNGKFRFLMFYYDSFIELIKMGVIVPAFDGFEEMFMESSSGEALSALGILLNRLESQGALLIAARKAYFDYKNFSNSAKLYDTIATNYFSFSRMTIDRWNKEHFVEYGKKRNVFSPEKVYTILSRILGEDHPILTRAVLVKQIFDSFKTEKDFEEFSKKIRTEYSYQYFSDLVNAIIEREAKEKWIDRSGEPMGPLISPQQHIDLLAMLAEDMWINNTEYLRADMLDFDADLFSELIKATPDISRQIRERIKQHALITLSSVNGNSFAFDHEEFRHHFIGIASSKYILSQSYVKLRSILSVKVVPEQTIDAIICEIKNKITVDDLNKFTEQVCKDEGLWSFLRQNMGAILIKMLNNATDHIKIQKLIFPQDSLKNLVISKVTFTDCYFYETSLENSSINSCVFDNCTFDGMEFYSSTAIMDCELVKTEIKFVREDRLENSFYDPYNIRIRCSEAGFTYPGSKDKQVNTKEKPKQDEELELTMRMVKRFLKTSSLNESIFKAKLGKKYAFFESKVLPRLMSEGILTIINHEPLSEQGEKHFKLGKQMKHIDEALTKCGGKFGDFLSYLKYK